MGGGGVLGKVKVLSETACSDVIGVSTLSALPVW